MANFSQMSRVAVVMREICQATRCSRFHWAYLQRFPGSLMQSPRRSQNEFSVSSRGDFMVSSVNSANGIREKGMKHSYVLVWFVSILKVEERERTNERTNEHSASTRARELPTTRLVRHKSSATGKEEREEETRKSNPEEVNTQPVVGANSLRRGLYSHTHTHTHSKPTHITHSTINRGTPSSPFSARSPLPPSLFPVLLAQLLLPLQAQEAV
jgi:hypothetical protein